METFSRGETSQQPSPNSFSIDRFLRPGEQATQARPSAFLGTLPDTQLTDTTQKLADGQLLPSVNIERQQYRFTEQNFNDASDAAAKSGKPIVALFGRTGNQASDNMMQKVAPQLQKQFGDRAEFIPINMDTPQGQKLAQQFNGSSECPYAAVLSLVRGADGKVKPVSAPSMGFRAGDAASCSSQLNKLLPAADRSMQLAGFLREEAPPTADKPPTGPNKPPVGRDRPPTGPTEQDKLVVPPTPTDKQPGDKPPLENDKPQVSPYKTDAQRKLADMVAQDLKRVEALAAARKNNPGVTPQDIPPAPNDTVVPPGDKPKPPGDKPQPPTDGRYKFTEADFDQAVQTALATGRPIVLKVGAPWCGPCRTMEANAWPKVQDLLKDNAIYVNINADNAQQLAQRFGVTSYPTVMVLKPQRGTDGNVTFKTVGDVGGPMGANGLREYLKRNLNIQDN